MDEDDQNEEQEEVEEEISTTDPEKNPGDQTDTQPLTEEIELQNDLAKELKNTLKIAVTDPLPDMGPTPYKVAIVGMNELGAATAFLLICRQVVTDVILIDRNAKRLAAEYADLSTCTTFVSGVNVQASSQLASCEGARVVILCGVSDEDSTPENPSAAQTTAQNEKIFSTLKTTTRAISLYAPTCVMLVAIQPFEVMTQFCASNSVLSPYRIFAPGTMIDSAHFRLLIGEKLEVSPASLTGMMIGGHGHNNLPLWSSVTVGGIHLLSENPTMGKPSDKENWCQLHVKVNQRQEEINRVKGTEVWSIGMACSELVECILRNKREIHPVTVNIKGYYQVTNDLFLSIPAIIGEHGVSHLITTNFDQHHLNQNDFSNIIESITAMVQKKLTHI